MIKKIIFLLLIRNSHSSLLFASVPSNFKYINLLERALAYTFPTYYCVQILSDKSDIAQIIQGQLYQTSSNISFINEVRTETCYGYVLIAKHIKYIMGLLEQISLLYENRLLVLVGEGYHKNLDALTMNPSKYFSDSELLLVILGRRPRFFIRKQPVADLVSTLEIQGSWSTMPWGVENFENRTVNIGTFNCTPFSSLGPLDENGRPSWVGGLELKLLGDIFKRLNLTMRMVVPNSKDMWGQFDGDKWNDGIMGLVSTNQVDIAFCGLWLTRGIFNLRMQTSSPLAVGCLKLLVPVPELQDAKWSSLYNPFPNHLWLLTGFSVVTASLSIFIFSRMQCYIEDEIKSERSFKITLVDSGFLALSIFLSAGGGNKALKPLRRLIIWWVLQGFLLTTCYSSGLITQLTSPGISAKMDTIRQLVENDYLWTSPYSPDLDSMLDFSDPWESTWAKRLRVIPNQEEEWNFLANKKAVLFGQQFGKNSFCLDFDYPNSLLAKFEVTKKNCISEHHIGMVFKTGSPFFKPVQKRINSYRSTGVLDKLLNDELEAMATLKPYVREVFNSRKALIKDKVKLKISNLKGAFLLWGIGLLTSILVFLTEIFTHKPARR